MSGSYLTALLIVFAVGCCIGRWLHRCVLRFPKHYSLRDQLTSLWREGDCRSCATWESGIQHLPIIGWLMAGRCRQCKRKMDPRRPVVELLTGLLLAGLYWVEIPDFGNFVVENSGLWTREGPSGPEAIKTLWSPAAWLHLRYMLHAVMLSGLIVATVIDFELCIIPDGCTVPAIIFAVLFSFAIGQTHLVPVWFQEPSTVRFHRSFLPDGLAPIVFEWDAVAFSRSWPHWHGLLVSLAGMIVGGGATWLVRAIGFWTLRQEAMGDGDVVLMALIGSVIGWQPVLVVFLLAIFLAVIPGLTMSWLRRESAAPNHFPYGPWLSLAALLMLFAWRFIWPDVKAVFDLGLILFALGFVLFALLAGMLSSIYTVKKLLGLSRPNIDEPIDWSSADHLSYYGAERPDEETGLWHRPQWPGIRAARGLLHYHNWHNQRQ